MMLKPGCTSTERLMWGAHYWESALIGLGQDANLSEKLIKQLHESKQKRKRRCFHPNGLNCITTATLFMSSGDLNAQLCPSNTSAGHRLLSWIKWIHLSATLSHSGIKQRILHEERNISGFPHNPHRTYWLCNNGRGNSGQTPFIAHSWLNLMTE